ncbi:MAG: hypothetical protein IPH54_20670 [Rhodoferax sp.]|nr:hypothetical protein [Rhodoferax sp.]
MQTKLAPEYSRIGRRRRGYEAILVQNAFDLVVFAMPPRPTAYQLLGDELDAATRAGHLIKAFSFRDTPTRKTQLHLTPA